MELFDKIFGDQNQGDIRLGKEHAVIVHFTYYKDDLEPLHELERKLEEEIKEKNVGEYDGHEIAVDMSDGFLYMYGPNAENLFKAIKHTLEETDFTKGSLATLRFGRPGSDAQEIEVEIVK
jgi:hypothetical protein